MTGICTMAELDGEGGDCQPPIGPKQWPTRVEVNDNCKYLPHRRDTGTSIRYARPARNVSCRMAEPAVG
ncbi:hypothetical protein Q1695_011410 [Nippostrongylus brasiliensis]|nr:hypothetical protein Q1695_011410 [Nippostrongylus brasiliensis]